MQKDLKIFEVLFSSFSSVYQLYEGFRNTLTLTSQEKTPGDPGVISTWRGTRAGER
jgi:hypothetical protein